MRAPAVIWTPEMDALLGKTTDMVLAKQLGLTREQIVYRRQRLGVASIAPPLVRWNTAWDVLLGTMSDPALATQLGYKGPHVVTRRRCQLKITAWRPLTTKTKKRLVQWTPELDALLGTLPDLQLAKMLGYASDVAIIARRKLLGISAWRLKQGPQILPCKVCQKPSVKQAKRPSQNIYCSKKCANEGQRRRDSDMLRYGAGWKATQKLIRERDQVCQSCKKTPEENGDALDVHHLKPFRYQGTNQPDNLIALCAMTKRALDSINVEVSFDRNRLTVTVDGKPRLSEDVIVAAVSTKIG